MEEIEYQGYKITAQSYQDGESGRWVPKALVVPVSDEASGTQMPISWEREFDTQQEADDFAAEGAQFHIDNYL